MITPQDYPNGFLPQIVFPIFSKEDCEKLNTLFDTSFAEDLIIFLTENAGNTTTKTCLVTHKDGEYEVQGFLNKWLFDTLYDLKKEIIETVYEEYQTELKELHQNYLLLAEVNGIDTLWVGVRGKYKGKVILLDEQRGQDFNEIWDYTTLIAKNLKIFQKRNLIDFEEHKNDKNLYW